MDLNYIIFQFPLIPNVYCIFQGRSTTYSGLNAGNISFKTGDSPSEVLVCRQTLFADLYKQGMLDFRECHQIHGDTLLFEPDSTSTEVLPEADGMATTAKGVGLLIKTADCQPVLVAHRSGKYIMALHIGWRGNRIGFPISAIQKFTSYYGIKAKDLFAVRGPSLGPSSAEFVNFEKEWGSEFEAWYYPENSVMNLWELTKYQLQQVGLPESQIYGIDICTALNSDKYFSYRKDKRCGRQANIIWRV